MTKKKKDVNITVKVMGKFFNSVGDTFDEAFSNLGIRNAKGLSVWTVQFGEGKPTVRVIHHSLTFRLFLTGGTAQKVALKNLKLMFGL
jgi:hypothetical protein